MPVIQADFHTHTNYSSDSEAPMADMIQKAIDLGLTHLALTDHVDYMSDGQPYLYQIDYTQYVSDFNRIKSQTDPGKIKLIFGVELGLAPHLEAEIHTFINAFPFEFIIGSSHESGKLDIYTYRKDVFANKTKKQAYEAYLLEILENIRLYSCFDVYGHLDYITRYAPYEDCSMAWEEFPDLLDAILKALIERGKGIEVNTSGYRYGLGRPHPDWDIVSRYRALGGEIITVGSDAHFTQDLASHFDQTAAFLKAAGFKAYTVFENRKPIFKDL